MPKAHNKIIVLDIEGNSKDVRADPASRTLGLSYGYRRTDAGGPSHHISGYLPFYHLYGNLPREVLHYLRTIFEHNNALRPVAHNFKYDGVGLRNNLGIDVIDRDWFDTMLMVHFINENLSSKSLDSCSRHYGGEPKNKSEAQRSIEDAFGYEYVPVDMMSEYSTNDSDITLELFEKILPEFNRQGFNGELWEYEREWTRFVVRMESVGIAIDTEMCERESGLGTARMEAITNSLGGNPGSPLFLSRLLHDDLSLPIVKKTPGNKPSFDKEAMAEYEVLLAAQENETAQAILEYRGWQKTVSSNYQAYLKLLSPDGFLRPNYKLHGTRTSRMSCEKPNLQQIPRSGAKRWNGNLKKAFIAREGYTLYEADYAQLELRLAAVYAGDETLLRTFRAGDNVFTSMSSVLGWPRQDCKTFTYTVLYGGGDRRVSTVFRVPLGRASTMRQEFFSGYGALQHFSGRAAALAKSRGYVKMWTGRRRHFLFPEDEARKAGNAIIQGGAAEIVKRSGIRIGHNIDWDDCKVLLQVHDSYLFEIRNGTEDYWIPQIRHIMEDVGSLFEPFNICPFPVEIKQWGTSDIYIKDLASV